jgi:hemerythrin
MPLAPWNRPLSVGVPELDRQHQQLLDQLNTLIDAMHTNQSSEKIQTIVRFVGLYATQHFGYEREYLQYCQCSIAFQDAVCTEFTQTLQEIQQELNQKGSSSSLAIQVKEQLLDRLVHHIQQVGKELEPFFIN